MHHTLKRAKLSEQISADPLKILALGENILANIALTTLVFLALQKTGLTSHFLTGAALCGILAFLIITTKNMYHDNALSQLELAAGTDPIVINSALENIGYTRNDSGEFVKKKKMFSLLHRCKSEKILIEIHDTRLKLKGPHAELEKVLATPALIQSTSI